jgi:anti-sigma regulatory factor (Ser/Thr protein kinase)
VTAVLISDDVDSPCWRVPADPRAVRAVRTALRAWLQDRGIDEDIVYDLLLAAGEAVTNAVEHAQNPTEPVVDVTARLVDGELEVCVRDRGQWRERTASMDRGRGSTMMGALADVSAARSAEGTTVTIRRQVAAA